MLPLITRGNTGPLIVLLHWLGGSAKSWTEVMDGLSDRATICVAIDLPGFGSAADRSEAHVESVAEAVIATIQSLRAKRKEPWFLVGHSMGGKFAAIIARAATDGRTGLDNLSGLILVSPSPPGPEPMAEGTRQKMIASLGHSTLSAEEDRTRAEQFIDANTGKLPLLEEIYNRTVNDVLRMNRTALVAWLTSGSKEDWASRVGTLPIPALVLAGTEEPSLGPDAQRRHTLPHFPNATLVALEGGGHLAPLERPAELVQRIVAFVEAQGIRLAAASLAPNFRTLIDSSRTSRQTRAVLDQRLADDYAHGTRGVLTQDEVFNLHSIAARVLPDCSFDLASRVNRWLAAPQHDGWRHDGPPPDAEAWHVGLRSITAAALRKHGVPFLALDADRQDEILSQARDGEGGKGLIGSLHLGADAPLFTATQMRDWFADLRAELVRIYMADPRTMCRVGFTGFADEGGFVRLRINEQEDFEL